VATAIPAAPANAGESRVGVEIARGRVVIHADFGRHERDRDHGRRVHRHDRDGQWIPGHYELRTVRFWVPATVREEYVPPVYVTRTVSRGVRIRVLVRAGFVRRLVVPAHYESRQDRVYVPGHWSCDD
jgi:hypothetical protein